MSTPKDNVVTLHTKDISADEFLEDLFDPGGMDDDETVCVTHTVNGNVEPTINIDYREKGAKGISRSSNAHYFCVASTSRKKTALQEGGYEQIRRGRTNLKYAYVIGLDDIGTKATAPDVGPTYRLETSPDPSNEQWGYAIEPLELTSDNVAYYEACQRGLSKAGLNDSGAEGVYRILRTPGSRHLTKGDKFHARLLEWKPERIWELSDLMAELDIEPIYAGHTAATESTPAGESDIQQHPIYEYLESTGNFVEGGKIDNGKVHIDCPFAEYHSADTGPKQTSIFFNQDGTWGFGCQHEHEVIIKSNRTKHAAFIETLPESVRAAAKDYPSKLLEHRLTEMAATGSSEMADAAIDSLLNDPTEDNVAQIMEIRLQGKMLHVEGGRSGWYVWDGARWSHGGEKVVLNTARNIARKSRPRGNGKTHTKVSFAKGACQFAAASPVFARNYTEFDSSRWLLNTPSGVFDLRDQVMRGHSPDDMLTLITNVGPDENGGKVFEQFMVDITQGDDALYGYMQRSLGAALSGGLEDQTLDFFLGNGRNGKNTLTDVVHYVMGSYSKVIPSSTLVSLYDAHKHPTDQANLLGVRMAIASEIPDGSYWDESAIKNLTGDAVVAARFMRGDFFEIPRTWRLFALANSAPQMKTADPAIQSRLKMVPFDASFYGREDRQMADKLRGEAGYILYWLMAGHKLWLENGMTSGSCERMDEMAADYYRNQGTVDAWLKMHTRAIPDEDGTPWERANNLYVNYKMWKEELGGVAMKQARFSQELKKRHSISSKSLNVGTVYALELIPVN